MSRWAADAAFLTRRAPNAQRVKIGVTVTYGPVEERDVEGIDASGMPRLDRRTVAVVPTADVDGVARHTAVTVGLGREAVSYTLYDRRAIEDGLLTELHLARVVS